MKTTRDWPHGMQGRLHQSKKNIRRFVKDNSVDVLTITETHQTSDKRPPGANGLQWFGRPTQSSARGGVGILIRSELIHNTKVTTFNGDAPDSFHLAVQPHNSRTTLISVVYGKTGLTEAEAEAQWGSYSRDLRRIRRKIGDFDHIFTGDINGRMGKPQNPVEEAHLGLYGESTRNPSGKRAVQFLIDEDLVCLNGRNPETAVEYTYQSTSAGREHYASVIDIIAISRGMYRREYRASVCPDTIALTQDHYAVLTDLRLNRSKIKKRLVPFKSVWNAHLLANNPENSQKFQDAFKRHLNRCLQGMKPQQTARDASESLSLKGIVLRRLLTSRSGDL